MLFTISIIEKEKKFCIEINNFNKDIVETNHILIQMPKHRLVKIFQSNKEAFCISVGI